MITIHKEKIEHGRKKILLIRNTPVAGFAGGAQKVLCDMENELTLRGHQVTVVHNSTNQGLPFLHEILPLTQTGEKFTLQP